MAATICFGGFCIPVYALLPFAFLMFQGLWNWFRKNVLGQDDDKIPENSRVVHVTSEEQFKELVTKGKTTKRCVVVDFSATWCGPCRYIGPIFHMLSVKYPHTIFSKVDVDELNALSKRCGVTAMPTFHFFHGGVKCDELLGADKSALERHIQKHYVEVELPEDEQPVHAKTHVTGETMRADGFTQRKLHMKTVTSET